MRGLSILMLMMIATIVVVIILPTALSPLRNSYESNAGKDTGTSHIMERSIRYVTHGVIRINNDTEFDAIAQQEGWSGSGGYLDPYIIENYEIDAHGKSAIYIGNTTRYFIIRYGHFYNSTVGSTYYRGAINLVRVTHGYITGCNISDSNYGTVFYDYTSSCEISYTDLYNVTNGIYIYFHTSSITVDNNNFKNYYVGGNAIEISYSSHDNDIMYNTITNTGKGIFLDGTHGSVYNNRITRNTIDNPADEGIYLGITLGANNVENNTVKNSHYEGIRLYAGAKNTKIVNNTILNSMSYGIEIYDSSDNLIYNNSLVGNNGATDTYDPNHIQAYNNGTNNIWYHKGRGNYWADWTSPDDNGDGIVDFPYVLDGDQNTEDPYPLVNPPTSIPEISALIIAFVGILMALVSGLSARISR